MPKNHLQLFIHYVWATYDREPVIGPEMERVLHREIFSQVSRLGCTPLQIGSMEDHLHLLVQMSSTIAVAELMKQVKGASSLFVNDELKLPHRFRWQGSYGALTVSRWDVNHIQSYIRLQKEHHGGGTAKEVFEVSNMEDEGVVIPD